MSEPMVFVEDLRCSDGTHKHDWSGKWEYSDDGRTGTATCAKCGMSAMHHSLMMDEGVPPVPQEKGDK